MGSGKSIIAKELSKALSISAVDTDDLIEKRLNKSINSIFSEKGELFFRKLEHQIFTELTQTKANEIISTGGGTPCYFNNHEVLMADNCLSIYLSASIDTLFIRLKSEKATRPLLTNLNDAETKEFIAKQLFERSYYYNKAKFKIDVNNKTIAEIVAEISNLLA